MVPSPPLAGGGPVEIYNQNHQLLAAVSGFCANLAWTTCFVPEYTDDQAFMGSNKQTYGPPAFIAPAQNLNGFVDDDAFKPAPVLVAYVYVMPGAGSLPTTYTDLRLNRENNCVYLWHTGSAFKAYVTPPSNNTCPTTYTANVNDELRVIAIAYTDFPNHPDIPPVARFHEGIKGQSAGDPFLGTKCGNKWCLVLPLAQAGTNVSEWRPPHAGVHDDRRTWAVYGWNDSQHLAITNATSGSLERSTMRASVVAVSRLDTIKESHYASGFQHVATVYFQGGTSHKYKNSWHFGRGKNEVYLMVDASGKWKAEIRRRKYIGPIYIGTDVTPANVERRDHNAPVPGTARFLWTIRDEDLWIACDDGCCRVAG